MITYQVESWKEFSREAKELFVAHWEEVALNKEQIPLDVDYSSYELNDAQGSLHIVTVRKDGTLIGYHASIIKPHLHYVSSLTAYTDVYFLTPENRTGRTGIKLFKEVEKTLKDRGVERIITTTKTHLDKGKIFTYLGYKDAERVFTKYIGNK